MSSGGAIHALRRFRAAPGSGQAAEERCVFCAASVDEAHAHRIDPEGWRVVCACHACDRDRPDAPRLRRIGRRVEEIADARIGERMMMMVDVPVGLAFFVRTSRGASVFYPGPTGTAEARIDSGTWNALAVEFAPVARLETDIEAILVSLDPRRTFSVPIDECFRLAGMLRTAWVGWSGGPEARRAIETFFVSVAQSAQRSRSDA